MLATFAPRVRALLQQLRAYASLTVLDALTADLDTLNDSMVNYRLRPRDALHYAAMRRVSCADLASSDPHFDRVPGINRYTV
ncbi:MAG: type II toxin-antitoxin system VapC family toxin [Chloroflexi bacterium]|nr:type II toxin-antitoxin system VapC family toxin [Chloroflexota bacterium]